MMTLELANGSRVPLVDVKRSQAHAHFFSRDKYYVQVELRDGRTEDVVEQLSPEAARSKKAEISRLIDEAWAEFDAYEYGYCAGVTEGQSQGYSTGKSDGQSEGRRAGYMDGFEECRRWILSYLFEAREARTRELTHGMGLSPSGRRFLRNAITVLTEIIERFSAEPA